MKEAIYFFENSFPYLSVALRESVNGLHIYRRTKDRTRSDHVDRNIYLLFVWLYARIKEMKKEMKNENFYT